MPRRPQDKGRVAEVAALKYWNARTGQSAERIAKHGAKDEGDVAHLEAHGLEGLIEVKNYKSAPSDSELAEWRRQTEVERLNAGKAWAVLWYHRPRCNMEEHQSKTFGRNWCDLTVSSYHALSGLGELPDWCAVGGRWVTITVDECMRLVTGEL